MQIYIGFKVAVISRDNSKLEKLKGFVSPGTKNNLTTIVGNVGKCLPPDFSTYTFLIIFAVVYIDDDVIDGFHQAQRKQWRRWNRPCSGQWERSQMWCLLWASAGGREVRHTLSLLKNCTGWAYLGWRRSQEHVSDSLNYPTNFVIFFFKQVIETLLYSTFVSWKAFFPLVRDNPNSTYTFITGGSLV